MTCSTEHFSMDEAWGVVVGRKVRRSDAAGMTPVELTFLLLGGAVLEVCVDLDGRVEDVATARHFVARALAEWDLRVWVDDACLITSELVANAVIHSRTPVRVTVRADAGEVVRIEVYDENSRLPALANPPDDATSGRGLAVVAGIATTWGTRNHGEGKTVWAQLGRSVMDEPDCIDLTDVSTRAAIAGSA